MITIYLQENKEKKLKTIEEEQKYFENVITKLEKEVKDLKNSNLKKQLLIEELKNYLKEYKSI